MAECESFFSLRNELGGETPPAFISDLDVPGIERDLVVIEVIEDLFLFDASCGPKLVIHFSKLLIKEIRDVFSFDLARLELGEH